jgi:serine/threonine protein kinase
MESPNPADLNAFNKRPKGPFPAGTPAQTPERSGPPEILPNEVEKINVLGDGSFGTVYQGRCRSKDVAVKVLHKQDLDMKTLTAFRKEVEILSQIYHPNIVLFMGACTQPGSMCIVTELLPKGDVEAMLQDKNCQLSLVQRMKMAKDAALGMAWLHGSTPQFVHRDLKTANLLVDSNLNVKVCDFGLSQIKSQGDFLRDGSEGAKGTPLWMAPEVMLGQAFNEKADIYSFGIVLWEILTRSEPFQEFDNFEQFRAAVCYEHRRPPIPDDTNPKLRRLIERCWHSNPSIRPPFKEIVELLDEVIVDVAIADEFGRRFWKESLRSKDQVKWAELKNPFVELLEWSHKNIKRPQPVPFAPDEQPTLERLQEASASQLEEFALRGPLQYAQSAQEFARRAREGLPLEGPVESLYDPSCDELNFKCFKAVLAEPSPADSDDDICTLDRFGKVLSWFGPLVDPVHGVIMLPKIRMLLSKRWFHGDLSTRDAEVRLVGKGVGAFLVRFSTFAAGTFTLSRVSKDGSLNHQRILYQPGTGFLLHNRAYPSLDVLLASKAQEMNLQVACLGSKYSSLFMDIQSTGYQGSGSAGAHS